MKRRFIHHMTDNDRYYRIIARLIWCTSCSQYTGNKRRYDHWERHVPKISRQLYFVACASYSGPIALAVSLAKSVTVE